VIKSIMALLGSFAIYVFVLLALTIAAAVVFGARAGGQTLPFLMIALAGAALSALVAGYSCAALAPMRPHLHTAVLAAMILLSQLSALSKPPAGQPHWYSAALAVVAPLLAWGGGFLRRVKLSPAASALQT
jgi:hypothetical protein